MQSIKKNKLKDEVRKAIQNAILSGELKPGDRIVETRLAVDMGVSQAPVREALKELEHIGLIENRPYQGTYVKELTKKDLQDAYDARLILEMYAIKEAALHIKPDQLDTLNDLIDNMSADANAGDVEAFADHDIDFHEAIIQSAGNDMVNRLWNLANISLFTHVTANLSKRSLGNLASRHNDIFKTLKDHDVEGAQAAMQVHLHELRDELIENTK